VLNLNKYITEIEEHFHKEYPREGCGVLGVSKGKLHWIPCKNIAISEEDFVFDSTEYLEIKRKYDIVGIVHSHPDCLPEASDTDINNCNALGIPYYIFSYPEMDLNIVKPKKVFNKLIGREYEFGVLDCFEAARDWYEENGIFIPHREPFEDDWWEKGLDYFNEEYICSWGFKKVQEPTKGDLLIFNVDSLVGNHCGVYLGNDIFFHHAQKRLSCRENLYPFWIKYLMSIYRYDA
jgi:proteasome lid subunit RPN8/RPN11